MAFNLVALITGIRPYARYQAHKTYLETRNAPFYGENPRKLPLEGTEVRGVNHGQTRNAATPEQAPILAYSAWWWRAVRFVVWVIIIVIRHAAMARHMIVSIVTDRMHT